MLNALWFLVSLRLGFICWLQQRVFFLCIDTQVPFASQIRFEKLLLYIYPKVLKKQEEKSNRLR